MSTSPSAPPISAGVRWLIVIIASIGFAFDIYELLMLPLILRYATQELAGAAPGTPAFDYWKGMLFWVPALCGGVFGLLGGYLTDLLGRRRVLVGSILLYAVSAFLAGFSTSMPMLLILRTTTFIGVCVEFVAAVAWLAELFPDPHQRERALGFSQAFSSFGGLLVAIVNGWIVDHGGRLPAIGMPGFLTDLIGQVQNPHAPWRYTLMSGLLPAIPLLLIRPFLPESPAWQQKKRAGTLKRPSLLAIFSPEYRKTTIVTALMVGAVYGVAFGAIQQLPDIVPGLGHVKEKAAKARAAAAARELEKNPGQTPDPKVVAPAGRLVENKTATEYTKVQEVGGLAGRFTFAVLAGLLATAVSPRWLLRVFQWPGLVVVPLVFYFFLRLEDRTYFEIDLESLYLGKIPISTMSLGMFIAGFFTVAQFSFWGNYLPRVYPTHLRGTGESFAANVGGRMIGTSFAAVTAFLASRKFFGDDAAQNYALASAGVALALYIVGSLLSFLLPEPKAGAIAE